MDIFLVVLFIAPSVLLVSYVAVRVKAILVASVVALLLRLSVVAVHVWIIPLPGGLFDALAFEEIAWYWATQGLDEINSQLMMGPRSNFYSTHIAYIYHLFGRQIHLLNLVSVFFSLFTILLVYKLALELWANKRAASNAAWIVAVFPWFVVYSSHARREVFIYFFSALAALYFVKWYKGQKLSNLLAAMLFILVGVFYHTGLVFALVGLSLLLLYENSKGIFSGRSIKISMLPLFPFIVALIVWAGSLDLAKIGGSDRWTDVDATVERMAGRAHGGAAYPSFVLASNPIEVAAKSPIMLLYFFGSPFVWDVRSPHHLVAMVDGIAYIFFLTIFFRNFGHIWGNKAARALLLIFAPVLLAFVFTVGNFGNAMRHRQKFLIILVCLVVPFLTKVRPKKI